MTGVFPMPAVKARDLLVLGFIESYTAAHGYAPSRQEIATAAGYASTCGAQASVDRLQAAGLLDREPRIARSLRVL